MITRVHSPQSVEAARLLGARIRAARLGRRWSQADLAGRAGISDTTLRKVERGDPSVALGTAFELAALLNVPLFHEDPTELARERERVVAQSALLPQYVRKSARAVHDDF